MSFSLEQIQKIFEEARGLCAEERAGFLEQACAGDAALRAEVESLLRHLDEAGGEFLKTYQSPAAQDPNVTVESPLRIEVDNADSVGPEAGVKSPDDILESARGLLGIPSDLIDGYTILRELHRGGQGIVYQAIQKGTKRKVAIKVLLEGPFASKSAKRRFEREIELVARLRHANIVEVFHSGQTTDGRQYCVMDYVRGTPLDQYVKAKKLSMEDALALFTKVCEAVNYAHQRGVIHRDLKPSNILVDSEGVPKVLDFGLAKQLSGPDETMVSLTGQVVGTLPYMSPEQAKGNPDEIDIRTDVYSLGVILYEVLTGTYPYPVAGQMAEVLNHIASTPPTPPSRTWKKDSGVQHGTARKIRAGTCPIDDEVQTIVLRSLAKERNRRYQSAGELAKDVEHYLKDEPIEAKKDSRLYILKAAIRRNRAAFTAASAVVLFALASVIAIRTMASRIKPAKDEAQTLYNSALALATSGDLEGAIGQYREATTLDPILLDAWFNMGIALRELGEKTKALDAFETARQIEPNNLRVLASLVAMSQELNDPVRLKEYTQLLLGLRSSAEMTIPVGYMCRSLGLWHEALDCFRLAAKQSPDEPAALHQLAWAYLITPIESERNAQEALRLALQIRKINPDEPGLTSTLALAYLRNGEAATALRQFSKNGVQSISDYFVMALCQIRNDLLADAKGSYNRGCVMMDTPEGTRDDDARLLRPEVERLMSQD